MKPPVDPMGDAGPLLTVADGLAHARRLLGQNRVVTAALDARLLVCEATGIAHEQLILEPDADLGRAAWQRLENMLARRINREPVSRIIGARMFWKDRFLLNADTLDPRPDSETLIEAALECAKKSPASTGGDRYDGGLRLLDLGTGSGCLLISLLRELPQARGIGVDVSAKAVAMARRNAQTADVSQRCGFVCANWADALKGHFDLVISNPPYISTQDIGGLEPEVSRYDPCRALDGGVDGLDAYRDVIPQTCELLSPGGWLVLEVGDGQAAAVRSLLRQSGLGDTADIGDVVCDLAGRARCVRGRAK